MVSGTQPPNQPSGKQRWFDSEECSDVLLRIYRHPCDSDAAPADGPAPQIATQPLNTGKQMPDETACAEQDNNGSSSVPLSKQDGVAALQPVRTYHAHRIVLRQESAFFDTRLSNFWAQQEAQRQQQQSKKRKHEQEAAPSAAPFILDIHLSPSQDSAMDLLLRFIYDYPLPAVTPDATPVLFQCLKLADEFGVPQCVGAIIKTLRCTATNEAVLRHVHHVPPSTGITDRPDFKALMVKVKNEAQKLISQPAAASDPTLLDACKRFISEIYSDVPAVIRSEKLRQEFCALPFAAVLAWAESDELRVQSENCVVYLLNKWVQAAQCARGQRVSANQLERLAQQVRVLQLGPAYQHHILPQLAWFKGSKSMAHLPTLLAFKGRDAAGSPVFPAPDLAFPTPLQKFPSQWVAKARQQSRVTDAHKALSWEVSGDELAALSEGYDVSSSPLYLNGFMLSVSAVTVTAADGTKTLNLSSGVNYDPMAIEDEWSREAVVLMGTVSVTVAHSRDGVLSSIEGPAAMLGIHFWSFPDVLSKSDLNLSELMAHPYRVDGKLHVEARFTTVDKVQQVAHVVI